MKIVNPDSGQRVEHGEEGLILVRGANRMKGYLNRPDKTEEVFEGPWYITGDIGQLDDDGFLFITDRLARFSKIGGEMVPHIKIETRLNEICKELGEDCECVVTSVPDDRKGEKLVVLHTIRDLEIDRVYEKLTDSGLPSIWMPRRDAFHSVDEIPKLGSGKLDVQSVKEQADKLETKESTTRG